MPASTATVAQLYDLRNALINAEKALELQVLTNNPALFSATDTAMTAATALTTAQIGSGVATTALVPNNVKIVAPVSGTFVNGFTATVVSGVVTALVLS